MTVTVYILTTQGPVRIQRISAEELGVQSVICLDGRAQALPISSRYDAFVRNPTGVIERATGHSAYRMDVDQMIDDGDSWQLGVYLAHLSENDIGEDTHVFVTGEVDRELGVRPVSHVPEKLEQADDLMRALQREGKRVQVIVPQDDDSGAVDYQGIAVDQVMHVDQMFDILGISPSKPSMSKKAADQPFNLDKIISQRTVFWTFPVLLIVGWFLWTPAHWVGLANDGKLLELEETIDEHGVSLIGGLQRRLFFVFQDYRTPEQYMPELLGKMTMAPNPSGCYANTVTQTLSWDASISELDEVCDLVVQATGRSSDDVIVGRMGYWPDGLGKGGTPERTMRGSAGNAGHTWSLKFERLPTQSAIVRVVTLTGRVAPSGPQPWYATLLREPIDSAAHAAAKARIERLGYHVFVHDWERS